MSCGKYRWRWISFSIILAILLFVPSGGALAAGGDAHGRESAADAEGKKESKAKAYQLEEVTVTGKIADEATEKVPAVVESLTLEGMARINTVDTTDVFKYMPGSYLRKLYPGSTNRPLVIRGNSSFMTARTQVLMDGIQISDFLGAGHSNSPKWFMAAPQEIEQVDVVYGPFSAALSGNSMSGTALITTRFPKKREILANVKYFYQNFHEFETDEDIQGYSAFSSYGDRIGKLSLMVWYDRLKTDVQPISFNTILASATAAGPGTPVSGFASDTDPKGRPRYIIGSTGVQQLTNNTVKLKAGYELTDDSQVRMVAALWDSTQSYDSPESYLTDASGNRVYWGTVNIDGQNYTLSPSAFYYRKIEKQDVLIGLTYDLHTAGGFKVRAVLSSYNSLKNKTRSSGTAPEASASGGAGTVADNSSGWYTADLKVSRDAHWRGVTHALNAGYHFDQYFTDDETWNASNWNEDVRTSLNSASEGKTRTHALFAEDSLDLTDQWNLYLGARYEWWQAFDGTKATESGGVPVNTDLPDQNESNLSPKLAATFRPTDHWRLRYSLGWAHRYPTVGEMFYGSITAGGVINNANPDLLPEKVMAQDITVTRTLGSDSEARLTFFQDYVTDAINSQTNSYTNVRNYQNVDQVRTLGVEAALNKRRLFVDGLGFFANLAWTESEILRNDAMPASVGKTFPRVPRWRLKCVVDYAPTEPWFATLAGRYASRPYNELDNSDIQGGYGGVDEYFVLDARFSYRFASHWTAALGVDNITDESYFVSHPYPHRTYFAEVKCNY